MARSSMQYFVYRVRTMHSDIFYSHYTHLRTSVKHLTSILM